MGTGQALFAGEEVAAAHEPWLSAAQLAPYLNRKTRQIQVWFSEGAPHRIEVVNNQEVYRGRASEIRAWARAKGFDLRASVREGRARAREAREAGGGMQKPGSTVDVTLVDSIDEIVRERARELVGEVPFGDLLVQARLMFEAITKRRDGVLSPAEAKSVAESLAKLSGELRQLDEARFEAERRAGKWLAKDAAVRFIVELVGTFAVDMRTIESKMASKVSEHLISAGVDAVVAARVTAVAAREVTDEVATMRAEFYELAAERVTQAPGGGG